MSYTLIFYLVYFIVGALIKAYKAEQKAQRTQIRQENHSKGLLKTYEESMKKDMDFVKIFLQKVNQKNGATTHVMQGMKARNIIDALRIVKHYYHYKAINSIENWNPKKLNNSQDYILDLVQFLFEKYEVPNVVRNQWVRWNYSKSTNGRLLLTQSQIFNFYFHLANGNSVRTDIYLPFKFSRKAAHWLSKAPVHSNLIGAFWWCTFRAIGGDEDRANRIAYTNLNYRNKDFWVAFLQIVAQSDSNIWTADDVILLIEYIQLVKFGEGNLTHLEGHEKLAQSVADYNLRGKTLKSMFQFFEQRACPDYPNVEEVDDHFTIRHNNKIFLIMRLKNRRALIEEGRAMSHCVGGEDYHESCLTGESSIWSLRQVFENGEFERLVTIEVENRILIEIQSKEDGFPHGEEMEIIQFWKNHFGMKMSQDEVAHA